MIIDPKGKIFEDRRKKERRTGKDRREINEPVKEDRRKEERRKKDRRK